MGRKGNQFPSYSSKYAQHRKLISENILYARISLKKKIKLRKEAVSPQGGNFFLLFPFLV